jgi:pilus assembly protein CpaD
MTPVKIMLVAGALTASVLGGCAPYPKASWTPVEAPVANQVRWTESSHVVRFTAGDAGLSPGERGRLDAFLGRIGPESQDRVFLLSGESALDSRRATSVREHLIGQQIAGRQIGAGMAADDAPDAIKIVIGRYIVVPPSCPNWSKPSGGDANNRNSSNFGCATATNLGAMVADPGDLVAGQPLGAGDGKVSAGSVQRYRDGKLKELPKISTRGEEAE